MKLWSAGLFCILLICGCSSSPRSSSRGLATFTSTRSHFTVRFPSSWHRMENAEDVFNIANFPPSQWSPNFSLPKAGAMISVVPAPQGITSIQSWILGISLHFKLLDNREIPLGNPPPGACTRLVETQWKFPHEPGSYTYVTAFYCVANSALFRVELTNLDGNPDQARLQSVALDVARSLRSP